MVPFRRDKKDPQAPDGENPVHAATDAMIRQYASEKHWDTTHRISISHDAKKDFFDASTNNRTWKTDISLAPDFETRQGEIVRDAKLTVTGDPVRTAITAMMDHEYGHWGVCPQNVEQAEMILDGVSRGLARRGIDGSQVMQLGPYVSNMFMDVLVNGVNFEKEQFTEGHTILNTDRAYFGPKSKNGKKPGYEDYFGMFVDAQGKLTDSPDARGLAERYVTNYQNIEIDCEQLLASIVGRQYARKAFAGELTETDRQAIRRGMRNTADWAGSAEEFAKTIAPYIEDKLDDVKKNVHLSPMMAAMAGKTGKEGQNGQQEGNEEPGGGLSPQEKEQIRKEIIEAGVKRLVKANGGTLAGIDPADLPYAMSHEVFDEIYRQKADQIVVEFKKEGGDQARMTLFHMAKRRLDDSEPISDPMAWGSTIFINKPDDPEKKIWLFKNTTPYDFNEEGRSRTGSFENILFAVDVSGSMQWSNTPLDESRYDMCIRSIYSVINYLEKTNTAQYLKYGLMLFSDNTTWSGWVSYGDLMKLKRQLFEGFQGGDTIMDPDVLKQAVSEQKDGRFLTMITSDGEITNYEQLLPIFMGIIAKPNDVVLMQISNMSSFGEGLRQSGAAVAQINSPEDLVGLNLSIIDSRYGPHQGNTVEIKKALEGEQEMTRASKPRPMRI